MVDFFKPFSSSRQFTFPLDANQQLKHFMIPTASLPPPLLPLEPSAQSIAITSKEESLEERILGYQAYVCTNCLTSYTVAICVSKEYNKPFKIQHSCQAERVQQMQKLTEI
jgi:hypothetical protein